MSVSDQFSDWQRYRNYLRCLARQTLPRHGIRGFDASDIAQNVLAHAFEKRAQFQGNTQRELLAWLRKILNRKIIDEYRKQHGREPDAARRHELFAQVEDSSMRLETWAVDRQERPEFQAERAEDLVRLSDALAALGAKQRRVIELHYLQDKTFSEVARTTQLTRNQVAGLIWRAIRRLRRALEESSTSNDSK